MRQSDWCMYFKYTDCSTAYYRSAHFNERPIISKAIKEKYKRTKRYSTVYRKYPSLAKNRDDQCSSPDIADHPSDTPRLLLSPSVPGSANFRKVEKHDRRAVDKTNTKRKENKQSKDNNTVQAKYFSQEKGILHLESLPLSNCLLWSVDQVAILCCCCFSVGLTNL